MGYKYGQWGEKWKESWRPQKRIFGEGRQDEIDQKEFRITE